MAVAMGDTLRKCMQLGGSGRFANTVTLVCVKKSNVCVVHELGRGINAAAMPCHATSCTQYPLELTLEEIFHGCLKKVTHKRKVLVNAGEYYEEERTLTVDVKPGLPTGTRFVFEG